MNFSYDKFFADHERIYKMALERIYPKSLYLLCQYTILLARWKERFSGDRRINTPLWAWWRKHVYKNEKDEVKKFEEELYAPVIATSLRSSALR